MIDVTMMQRQTLISEGVEKPKEENIECMIQCFSFNEISQFLFDVFFFWRFMKCKKLDYVFIYEFEFMTNNHLS